MMLFLISDDSGRILQANKVYTDVDKYDSQLRENSINAVRVKHHSLLSPDRWMVNTDVNSLMRVRLRPIMPLSISKTVIKAGGSDCSVITGVPKGVSFSVTAAGSMIASGTLPDGEMEITIPCPITYEVLLMKWPYQECRFTIEAVA